MVKGNTVCIYDKIFSTIARELKYVYILAFKLYVGESVIKI